MRKNHPVLRGREKHHLNLLRLDAEIAHETLERHKRQADEQRRKTNDETEAFRARLFSEVRKSEGKDFTTLWDKFPRTSGKLD